MGVSGLRGRHLSLQRPTVTSVLWGVDLMRESIDGHAHGTSSLLPPKTEKLQPPHGHTGTDVFGSTINKALTRTSLTLLLVLWQCCDSCHAHMNSTHCRDDFLTRILNSEAPRGLGYKYKYCRWPSPGPAARQTPQYDARLTTRAEPIGSIATQDPR
jgi:hypothetical protein